MAGPDAVFLGSGTTTGDAVVTAVLALEETVDPAAVADLVRDRLVAAHPRFATRAVPGWWPLRRPAWVPVAVDLDRHVLDGGPVSGEDGLAAALGDLATRSLDMSRPPWQLHLLKLEQPGGTSSVLVVRVHHSLADGQALAAALMSLMDDRPDVVAPVGRPVAGRASAARRALDVVGTGVALLLTARDDPASRHASIHGPPAWTAPLDLGLVRRVAAELGATVNDVLLAVIAGALNDAGQPTSRSATRRVLVPVDLRAGRPVPAELGNRVGFALLRLPTGAADPVARVQAVSRATGQLRGGGSAPSTYLMLHVLGWLPRLIQRCAARFIGARAAAIVTNVRGPATPVHIAGARVVRVAVWVPLVGAVPSGVSILSYAGEVTVGVAADPERGPRPDQVTTSVEAGLAELAHRALGVPDDEVALEAVPFDSDVAATLVAEVQQEYVRRYGGHDETPVDPDEFAPPDGTFLVARYGAVTIGCAGMRRHDASTVEVKRMFVRAEHRRRGHARRLLRALEDLAREQGYRRVILETGLAQPEAIALYARAGYLPVEGFGHYRDAALSRSFAKDL
ncbi:MAG TPA: GNAT family N-acetyltransferase [Actinomycetes bacterium]|jgi:GNAT superfamily N-acetyltransferase|nr:GNAT family N-acetyltransferase [Actinomycetes bacterium]